MTTTTAEDIPPPPPPDEEEVKPIKRRVKVVVPVLPLKTLDQIKSVITFPSTIGIIGKKFSGKSNLLLNLIPKHKFDNVFVFTQSIHTGNLNELLSDPDNMFQNISDNFIELCLDFQKEHPDSKTLIIFDDFIDSERTLRDVRKLCLLFTSGRNFNISLVISSQNLTSLPTMLRKNLEYIFIGRNLFQSCKQISDEFSTVDLEPIPLKKCISELSASGRHDWLFYNDRTSEWSKLKQEEIHVHI